MLAVNTKLVTSSAQTVVPGLVVIVGFLGSSTFILTTSDGKPAPPVGQDTVFKVAKVSLRISRICRETLFCGRPSYAFCHAIGQAKPDILEIEVT